MASPVDTSVKNFNSTMANAPVLSGTAGALIALLDACLVTGFDEKVLTSLVALGGVMTATFSGTHSAQIDSVVLIAGVTGGPTGFAGANGEQKVVGSPSATTRTWATTLPDGTYTGSITMKMAPAGWEKVYSTTNIGVYRSLHVASSKFYLRVDDTGTTSARVVGYESMSDVNTGSAPFPTTVQMNGGGYWPKSVAASAQGVLWTVHADGRFFAFSNEWGKPASSVYSGMSTRFFGECIPLKPGGDAYLCALNYSTTSSVASQTDSSLFSSTSAQTATARSVTGVGGSTLHSINPYVGVNSNTSGVDASLGSFPSQVDGSLQLTKRYLQSSLMLNTPRGDIPGAYYVPQSRLWDAFRTLDKAPGSGALAGRTLQGVAVIASGNSITGTSSDLSFTGIGFFDITGPWRN